MAARSTRKTEVLVTCGGTEAMMSAMMTICNPGDKVDRVLAVLRKLRRGRDPFRRRPDLRAARAAGRIDFDRVAASKTAFRDEGAKAIIVCNPSNPCGKVFTYDELMTIAELCEEVRRFRRSPTRCMSTWSTRRTSTSAWHPCPVCAERTITCNSLSKTYSITGWRLGWLIGPAEIVEGAKKVHDFLTVGAPAPLQEAAVVGLNFPQSYYDDLLRVYTEKRDYFCDRSRPHRH